MKAFAGKRVLMLLENNPYPQDPRPRREARALTDAGLKVSIICPSTPEQSWRECVDGVSVYRYPAAPAPGGVPGYLWEYAYSMTATLILSLVVFCREGFDVVHAHNPPDTFVFVAAFYKLLGKKFVFDHHDLSPEMYNARFRHRANRFVYRVLIWAEKLSCRMADLIIATNQSYKLVEMARGKVPAERIVIVRNGPEVNHPLPPVPDLRLRQLGKTIIGYVGVMGYQDGVDYLLRSLRHVLIYFKRTEFLCVIIGGRGEARESLMALSAKLGLDDHVWFTGWVSDEELTRYLSSADICVVPDPSNPFNDRSTMIKMMEYMAVGKPIVAFDLPEHRFTAQQAALYIRPNDELQFARALVQLMDDPQRCREMGEFGRHRVLSELAWDHSIQHLLNGYERLFQHERKSAPSAMWKGVAPEWLTIKIKRLARWLELRSSPYIANRMVALLKRYGVTSKKAKRRTLDCIRLMARYGCYPTFPTPGRVIQRDPAFFRCIQNMGAEINVHGYDHIDFLGLSPEEARKQFVKAIDAFEAAEISAAGFRCPYLSYDDALLDALPAGPIQYSSNRAILWNVLPSLNGNAGSVFETLQAFYRADSCEDAVSTPRLAGRIVELPVGIPDDLQMFDGLKMDQDAVGRTWSEIIRETHRRGELFVLLFHPELIDECKDALETVLQTARSLRPAIWMTQLRDVCAWWREKAAFDVRVCERGAGLRLVFNCSQRASIVARDLSTTAAVRPFDDRYRLLQSREVYVTSHRRPFIGVPHGAPPEMIFFLREQGFIVDASASAPQCTLGLDEAMLARWPNRRRLLDAIEASDAPLVKFLRWPHEAKSALCMTGDLDALSLVDYAARIFVR